MSGTLAAIVALVDRGAVHVSNHAFEEMQKDGILPSAVIENMGKARVVEDYPDANRGPSVLVLLEDRDNRPLHAVWGIPRQRPDIAALITAYRPDPKNWTSDFMKRSMT